MDLASIYFGIFIGVFVFTCMKVVQQTSTIWKRTHSLSNAYVFMIWGEMTVNLIFAIITFLYLNGIIPGSLPFYLATVGLWAIQTQLLPQIIANRVSLIMINSRKALKLKLSLAIAIGCINIAVGYIWSVAQLPTATPEQLLINHIFEKTEKSFFLVVDLGLNLYFLYLVRFRLIRDGLSKYWRLFNFNAGIVTLSTSMDILLLGFLSLPDPYLYVQFSPLAYIVKLYIELLMAVMISKVVRSGGMEQSDGHYGSSSQKTNPVHHITSRVVISGGPGAQKTMNTFTSKRSMDLPARENSACSEIQLTSYPDQNGIVRTIETTVVVGDDDSNSDLSQI